MSQTEENKAEDKDECPICFDIFGTSWAQMCLQHRICGRCLVLYLGARQRVVCPCCRSATDFAGEELSNTQRVLYYTQQKRNRYLRIGDKVIQVEFQGQRVTEARAKRLIGAAVNLISHMMSMASIDGESQTLTFECNQIDVTLSLVGDILSINF